MSEENQRIYQDKVLKTLQGIRKGLEKPDPSPSKPPEAKEEVTHHIVSPQDALTGECPDCHVEIPKPGKGWFKKPEFTCPGCEAPANPGDESCTNCGSTEGVLE